MTDCYQQTFEFQALGSRRVVTDFTGGALSSDSGSLLLREIDRHMDLSNKLAACFTDRRDQRFVEHDLNVLVRQRLIALALGYEDLNDHDDVRSDPLLATACGATDPLGLERRQEQDKGKPLAGKSTLNRLELGAAQKAGKYRKINVKATAVRDLLIEQGVKAIARKSQVIVLDFDATDDPIHGNQEGRFFHGYYRNYCFLPLYCFCGDIPLWAELRRSNIDASAGTLEALRLIVRAIRSRFGRKVKIIVRGDSGFCREELMAWIEGQPNVHYVFGLPRNNRLLKLLAPNFTELRAQSDGQEEATKEEDEAPRTFAEFTYRTCKSWSRARRVIAKAEILGEKENPRFIVTDLEADARWVMDQPELADKQSLYEKFYCARGNMENRIKEQQLDLFADRTSTWPMAANQLRLWFSTFAYLLLARLRGVALRGTVLADATAGTIRLRLLKIASSVTVSVRRVHVKLASSFPLKEVFAMAHQRLCHNGPQPDMT